MHCLLLLPASPASLDGIRGAVGRRLPGATFDPSRWVERSEPRQVAYGPIEHEGYELHVLLDREGMPPAVGQALSRAHLPEAGHAAAQAHEAAVLAFLVKAPPSAGPVERVRALARLAFAFLDEGASLLAFPDGRIAHVPAELAGVDPGKLTADDLGLLCSHGFGSHPDARGRAWARTFGLHQVGLPELACQVTVEGAAADPDSAQAADALLANLPRYLLELGRPLEVGETADVGKRRWRVVATPQPPPVMPGPTGLLVLEREHA